MKDWIKKDGKMKKIVSLVFILIISSNIFASQNAKFTPLPFKFLDPKLTLYIDRSRIREVFGRNHPILIGSKEHQEISAPVESSIELRNVIKEIAKELNAGAVIMHIGNRESTFLYIHPDHDITDEVIKRLKNIFKTI